MRVIRDIPRQARSGFSKPALGMLSLLALGCSWMGGPSGPSSLSPYQSGLSLLAEGDFEGADEAFRESAASCESGREGRRAILFLSLLELDPRNPNAHPDSAALMAMRFLLLPVSPPAEALQAEGLYVAALDRGADPGLRPDPESSEFAIRFERCSEPVSSVEQPPLPVLARPTSSVLQGLYAERAALAARNEALQRTVEELQAELERIRGLMKLPDTTRVRRPPGP
ncbi:MAG: hypothetical protein ACWGSQ_01815 [Longimicrobiales bacterium]